MYTIDSIPMTVMIVKRFLIPSITIIEGDFMKTDVQISFRTTEEFKERLESIAKQERRPTASLIKIVLEDFVNQYDKEKENAAEHK